MNGLDLCSRFFRQTIQPATIASLANIPSSLALFVTSSFLFFWNCVRFCTLFLVGNRLRSIRSTYTKPTWLCVCGVEAKAFHIGYHKVLAVVMCCYPPARSCYCNFIKIKQKWSLALLWRFVWWAFLLCQEDTSRIGFWPWEPIRKMSSTRRREL